MIRKLMKSIRQYKLPSILAPIFVAFEVVMEVLIPYYMADLIDYGINAGNMSVVAKTGNYVGGFCSTVAYFWRAVRNCMCKGFNWFCGKSATRHVL